MENGLPLNLIGTAYNARTGPRPPHANCCGKDFGGDCILLLSDWVTFPGFQEAPAQCDKSHQNSASSVFLPSGVDTTECLKAFLFSAAIFSAQERNILIWIPCYVSQVSKNEDFCNKISKIRRCNVTFCLINFTVSPRARRTISVSGSVYRFLQIEFRIESFDLKCL